VETSRPSSQCKILGGIQLTRVLLVGSGAREHAIASALVRSTSVKLYAAMSSRNPGIIKLARDAQVMKIADVKVVLAYASRIRAELVVVGPEEPLVNGLVDAFTRIGIPSVGPTRCLALLEGDKAFCRELLERHGIEGNPSFQVFTEAIHAENYLKKSGPVAIKPVGLTSGKGVKVTGEDLPTKESEIRYAKEILQNRIGGVKKLVVEEKLEGEEYSVQAFVDGRNVHVLPPVQDHKRAYDGDIGPNTGGMGSYSDHDHMLPFLSKQDLEFSTRLMSEVVDALRVETGQLYKGILYGQFMLSRNSNEERLRPRLIEFNCRFGDPEVMNVLSILSENTDFAEICERIANGNLNSKHPKFEERATVCKYLVPDGYPRNAAAGETILVDEGAIAREGACCFYAGVDLDGGRVVTTTSRTIGLVSIGGTLQEAERICERAVSHVKGPLRHRKDIGTVALVQKRIEHIRALEQSNRLITQPQVHVT